MHILLTNDDGIEAPGLLALAARARALGRVTIVASERERSGVGHAITLAGAMPCRRLPDDGTTVRHAIDGTPADCVKLAVSELARDPIDLVLSGINAGANVGVSVLYSGTVAAALEAGMYGLPAAAVSLENHGGKATRGDFDRAADLAVGLIEHLLRESTFGSAPLNINLPAARAGWPLGWRAARQSLAAYDDRFEAAGAPDAYRLSPGETRREVHGDTDLALLEQGYATVTPLTFDLTDRQALAALRRAAEAVVREA